MLVTENTLIAAPCTLIWCESCDHWWIL